MSPSYRRAPRRRFLQTTMLAAASAPLLTRAALAADPAATSAPAATPAAAPGSPAPAAIPTRPFGKTGRVLPILGMGGSAMVKMFNAAYGVELLDMDQRVAMVRHAYDRGIRYFDTARVYGESEQIMGRGLAGVRDQCYVATKCHMTDPKQVRPSVEKSLAELGMDYVDCVQLHSPAIERLGVAGAMKIHAELAKLRDEGLCRFLGLTTHVAFESVWEMIQTGGFDQVLLAYGYFHKGMDTMLSNRKLEYRELCLAAAHERGMAIVAMKVMGANIFSHNSPNIVADFEPARREKLPAAAIRWTLRDERIAMLNIGASMPSDIDANLAVVTGDHRFTAEDRELLADFSRRAYDAEPIKKLAVT